MANHVELRELIDLGCRQADSSDGRYWLLNLDSVEKNSGRIIDKVVVGVEGLEGSIVPFSSDAVLYSRLRPNLNKVVLPDEGGYCTTEMLPLYPDASMLMREYLALYLRSKQFVSWAKEKTAGAKMPRISKKDLLSHEIPVVDLCEQRRIVESLLAVSSVRLLCELSLQKYDDLVESQFIEMFGDPAQNPMNWEIASLTSLGICKNGMNFKSKESGIELPCLGVGDFKDRVFINDVSEMGRVNLDAEPSEGCFLKDGDVVFVRSNGNKELVGRCLAVYPGDVKAVYSGFCIRLRVESENMRIPYLVWVLRQPSIRRQMFGRGANVQNLNQKLMAQIMVPIPPLSEQDRFVDFVAQVDKTKAAVQQSIDKLQILYDSLAQEYFGGGLG